MHACPSPVTFWQRHGHYMERGPALLAYRGWGAGRRAREPAYAPGGYSTVYSCAQYTPSRGTRALPAQRPTPTAFRTSDIISIMHQPSSVPVRYNSHRAHGVHVRGSETGWPKYSALQRPKLDLQYTRHVASSGGGGGGGCQQMGAAIVQTRHDSRLPTCATQPLGCPPCRGSCAAANQTAPVLCASSASASCCRYRICWRPVMPLVEARFRRQPEQNQSPAGATSNGGSQQ